jgi:hypothetical protein
LRTLQKSVGDLEAMLEKVPHGDTLKEATYFCETILPAINVVREWADSLETVVADDLWSLPSYQEMLFIKYQSGIGGDTIPRDGFAGEGPGFQSTRSAYRSRGGEGWS